MSSQTSQEPNVEITSGMVEQSLKNLAITTENTVDKSEADTAFERRVQMVLQVGEECIFEEELRALLKHKPQPTCYDGFEPSGRVHIAQGLMKAKNVNRLTSAGCKFVFWIADWFALMNNKMGGDLEKIRTVGRYMIEVWKSVGMQMDNVQFIWSSDEINARASEYWPLVIDISRTFNVSRIIRCSQIMGRSEKDDLSASQIFYPCMQCADIFFLKADICQLGMDQRKVNMLAREYCTEKKIKRKPIILSHHMLSGLKEGQAKMSKSDPESAIFMEDTEAEVNLKIKRAFCPPQVVENNPCLEYMKYICFPWCNEIQVMRSEKNGGNKTYSSYEEMEKDFAEGALHPADLKSCLAKTLNTLLEPVRKHFAQGEPKALLEKVRLFQKKLDQDKKKQQPPKPAAEGEEPALAAATPADE